MIHTSCSALLTGLTARWVVNSARGTLTSLSELLSLSHSCTFPADSRGWVSIPSPAASEKQGSEMSDILRELLHVSEKAASIARACRQQEALFQLLIEEKKEGEKNKKFAVDFKTLADVLVQEVIKQNMENKVRKVIAKVTAKYLPLWLCPLIE